MAWYSVRAKSQVAPAGADAEEAELPEELAVSTRRFSQAWVEEKSSETAEDAKAAAVQFALGGATVRFGDDAKSAALAAGLGEEAADEAKEEEITPQQQLYNHYLKVKHKH